MPRPRASIRDGSHALTQERGSTAVAGQLHVAMASDGLAVAGAFGSYRAFPVEHGLFVLLVGEAGLELEADHYILKPCSVADILKAIRLTTALIPQHKSPSEIKEDQA